MTSEEQLFTISKPKWQWNKVNTELRTKIDGKLKNIQLKPAVALECLDSTGIPIKLKMKVSIDTEKSLQYEDQIGWNWHKSSNLPLISLKVEVTKYFTELKHPESDVLLPIPENLQAHIFAAKIVVNTLEREKVSHLEDVGLRGTTSLDLREGCAVFNGIRFLTTSYNNEGVKLYFVILINMKGEGEVYEDHVCAVISPPIFVDSRKSARDYQEKKVLSFVENFTPDIFSKQFFKRETKSLGEAETRIENSMEGLYNYLTAPNIRHKVKHPLFLCVKFSNAFKIMYNSKCSCFSEEEIAKSLIKEIGKSKKTKSENDELEKPFLIAVNGECNSTKKSKVYESLEFLNCKAIEFVKQEHHFKSHHVNLFDKGNLTKLYKEIYSQLEEITSREIENRKKKYDAFSDQPSFQEEIIEGLHEDENEKISSFHSNEIEEARHRGRKGKKRTRSQTCEREADFCEEKELFQEISLYKTNSSLSEKISQQMKLLEMMKQSQAFNKFALNEANKLFIESNQFSNSKSIFQPSEGNCFNETDIAILQTKNQNIFLREQILEELELQNKLITEMFNENIKIKQSVNSFFNPSAMQENNNNNSTIENNFGFHYFYPSFKNTNDDKS